MDLNQALDATEFEAYVGTTEYFNELDEDDDGNFDQKEWKNHIEGHYENYETIKPLEILKVGI